MAGKCTLCNRSRDAVKGQWWNWAPFEFKGAINARLCPRCFNMVSQDPQGNQKDPKGYKTATKLLTEEKSMPNWCNNTLTVTGPYEDVKRFFDEVKGKPDEKGNADVLSFESHVPMEGPESDWYEEHNDKWGTKWNACESSILSGLTALDEGQGDVKYSFDTAWSPPAPWLYTVTGMFPTLDFVLYFEEPGMGYYGALKGTKGLYSEEEMDHHEYLMETDEEYPEYVKCIEEMTQEELVKYFSIISNFYDCCLEEEDWPQVLMVEKHWGFDISMDRYTGLAGLIVDKIETKNLPLFMGVNWGFSYQEKFKQRLAKGE